MALKFNPPPGGPGKTKEEAFAEGLAPTIRALPSLWMEYKLSRRKQGIEELELQMKERELRSKYGTVGETAGLPGMSPTPAEAAQLGTQKLTPEEQFSRYGTEGMRVLKERPTKSQLRVTDKNVPVLFNPEDNSITVQATGEPYNAALHGGIRLPGDPNQSNEGIRRTGLVDGGRSALKEVRSNMDKSVLKDLKIIRNDPLGGYEQISSSKSKIVLNNLRTAIENQLYLKTGATATEDETRNAMRKFLAAAGDDLDDFENRLVLLDRDFNSFTRGESAKNGGSSDNDPLGIR